MDFYFSGSEIDWRNWANGGYGPEGKWTGEFISKVGESYLCRMQTFVHLDPPKISTGLGKVLITIKNYPLVEPRVAHPARDGLPSRERDKLKLNILFR